MNNQFAIIKTRDIAALAKSRASACATLLYVSLLSYARDKVSCFPSVETLSRSLGGAYAKRTIYRALEWLCENGFIKRKDKRSKERFTIISRLVDGAKKVLEKLAQPKKSYDAVRVPRPYDAENCSGKGKRKKTFYKRKDSHLSSSLPAWRQTGNYERFENPVESSKSQEEEAWTSLCVRSHPPSLKEATKSEKEAIIKGITQTKTLMWVLDVYPDILVEA